MALRRAPPSANAAAAAQAAPQKPTGRRPAAATPRAKSLAAAQASATREATVAVFAHLTEGASPALRFVPAGLLRREATTLRQTPDRPPAQSFIYGLRYLERRDAFEVDPVALSLRDRAAVRGVALFPLPGLDEFGGIRDAAPDAWGRRVIEARLRVPANSLPEFTYLLEAGSDRVGALDVRPSIEAGPSPNAAGAVTSLPYLLQAAAAVEAGQEIPAHLLPYLAGASSAGGARPKASVRDERGVLWLAKFPARSDPFNMAVAEAATLELARRAGLQVPPLKVQTVAGQSVLLVKRFDRYVLDAGAAEQAPVRSPPEGRLPQISALTLLGCSEQESINKGYKQLAAAMREHLHPPGIVADCEELFARMVFNIFVSNDDDHLRNHAFLRTPTPRDPTLSAWRLSPLYDVVPRPMVAQERLLHLSVGHQGRLATLDNALSEHTAFIPHRPKAIAVLRRVWGAVREWKTCFEDMGATPALIQTMGAAIRRLEDVASAELAKGIRRGR
jgi:serine/threonine-protein kinase HipA